MKFDRVPVAEAEGAIAAHSTRLPDRMLHKGVVVTAETVAELTAAGVETIYVARMDASDVAENEVVKRLAERLAGANVTLQRTANGRTDLTAAAAGVFTVDRTTIDRLNLAHDAVQVSTLPEYAAVAPGQIVGTIKIIPFALAAATLAAIEAAVPEPALLIAPYRPLKVGVVATQAAHVKASILDKTRRVLDARLEGTGARVGREERTAHEPEEIARALLTLRDEGHEVLIIFGASATSDGADVVPRGIEAAGGSVLKIGMPVDPGNLLVLGELDGMPVFGAPGCARSPAPSGFDWVLQRLLAGIPASRDDVARMGVGGLLAEVRRPHVASDAQHPDGPRIDAVILAAGRSSRMNGQHKLLARLGDRPLVRIAAEAALSSQAASVTVVVGYRAAEVRAALAGLEVTIVENRNYDAGLSGSLRLGVSSLSSSSDGAIVLLADMPDVDSHIIDKVIGAFDPAAGSHVAVPTFGGKAGNPVLWSSRFYADLMALEGDVGARELIRSNSGSVAWIEVGPAVGSDVDTPEAMAAIGGVWIDESIESHSTN